VAGGAGRRERSRRRRGSRLVHDRRRGRCCGLAHRLGCRGCLLRHQLPGAGPDPVTRPARHPDRCPRSLRGQAACTAVGAGGARCEWCTGRAAGPHRYGGHHRRRHAGLVGRRGRRRHPAPPADVRPRHGRENAV
ncbi:MAG: hypothetical protein AVDCRST_MAG29-2335, partial [uncultured Nocardioidaceae bacterium]